MRSSSVGYGKPKAVRNPVWPEEWDDRIRSWEIFNQADGRLSAGSLDLYKTKLVAEFLPWAASIGWVAPIENMSSEHLRHFLTALGDRGLSGATRLVSRGAVRSLWRFLRMDDYIADDPFEAKGRIPRPKPESRVVPVLAPTDIERLLRGAARDPYLGTRDVAVISVLLDTGVRANELCGLELDDIDWREGRLLVRHAKGGRERWVSLGRQAMRALDRYQKWRREQMKRRNRWAEPCDALFITRQGSAHKAEHLRTRLKTVAARAGIDTRAVWPHKFRHTSATALADAGMGESELRMLFGWSRDSGMVERYTSSTTALRAQKNHKLYSPLDRLRG
jgi:site-specific recombinase XerD